MFLACIVAKWGILLPFNYRSVSLIISGANCLVNNLLSHATVSVRKDTFKSTQLLQGKQGKLISNYNCGNVWNKKMNQIL